MNSSNHSYRNDNYRRNTYSVAPSKRERHEKQLENFRNENEIKKSRINILDKENRPNAGNKQSGYITNVSNNPSYVSNGRSTYNQEKFKSKPVSSNKT